MMTPKPNITEYERYRLSCLSGSVVCQGGNSDPNDPDNEAKITWNQIPGTYCTAINDKHPEPVLFAPKCSDGSTSTSRTITLLPKPMAKTVTMSPGFKRGLIIGGIGLFVVVSITIIVIVVNKNKSPKS